MAVPKGTTRTNQRKPKDMNEEEFLAFTKGKETRKKGKAALGADMRKGKKEKVASKKKKFEDSQAKKKAAFDQKVSEDTYKSNVRKYQAQKERGENSSLDKKLDKFGDNLGDKLRGTSLNKANNMTSRDEKAKMRARKDVLGYKGGGLMKKKKLGMMKYPPLSAKVFDAMTDEQKAEYKFKQMGQTLGASPSEPVPKAKKKPVKKMMGGKVKMSAGGKLNMVKGKDGKMVPDYAADGVGKMKAGGMAKAYKEGGKVRGAGMAKKGVRACKMR